MKALATFLAIWVPVALIGWLGLAHPGELRVVIDGVMRTLGGA